MWWRQPSKCVLCLSLLGLTAACDDDGRTDTPGDTRWPGPVLGAHTDEVLGDLLGLTPAERDQLRADVVI